MPTDQEYLRRAIRLAMSGRGRVEPNPMVGCVIVKDDHIIGQGCHQQYGGRHAEPNALANCSESPAGATAYVTLEPCCHLNKQTPPCVPRLIEAKTARVVVGCLDPNPDVNGKGIALLRQAGIIVDGPMLEDECKQLIAPFLARVHFHRPYVTMKWAESADEKIAGPGGIRRQISNELSTKVVHQLRGRCDAIAVGIGTVLSDDPELTVRGERADRIPTRIVLDSNLRIPETSRLVQSAATIPTIVYCTDEAAQKNPAKRALLEELKVAIAEIPGNDAGRLQLSEMLRSIHGSHLLIEPGPTLARAFFFYGAADRLWVIRSPTRVDDDTAPSAAPIPDHFAKTGELKLGGDVLCEYLNTHSTSFSAAKESADLVMTRSTFCIV
jgi:diaminohydroxyphosphoribosylaminopyrimidine deaminase/5-amino-6-(5-phosphoribosylamino)uracil reductase